MARSISSECGKFMILVRRLWRKKYNYSVKLLQDHKKRQKRRDLERKIKRKMVSNYSILSLFLYFLFPSILYINKPHLFIIYELFQFFLSLFSLSKMNEIIFLSHLHFSYFCFIQLAAICEMPIAYSVLLLFSKNLFSSGLNTMDKKKNN